MTTRPSIPLPVWDSSLNNVSTWTGGHISNGYSNSEVPTAGEFNTGFNSWSQWISYHDALLGSGAAVSQVVSLSTATPTLGSPVLSTVTPRTWKDPTNDWTILLSLPVEPGYTISECEVSFALAVGTHQVGLTLVSTDFSGNEGVVAQLAQTGSPGIGSYDYTMSATHAGTAQTLLTPTACTGAFSFDLIVLLHPGDSLKGVKITKSRT